MARNCADSDGVVKHLAFARSRGQIRRDRFLSPFALGYQRAAVLTQDVPPRVVEADKARGTSAIFRERVGLACRALDPPRSGKGRNQRVATSTVAAGAQATARSPSALAGRVC